MNFPEPGQTFPGKNNVYIFIIYQNYFESENKQHHFEQNFFFSKKFSWPGGPAAPHFNWPKTKIYWPGPVAPLLKKALSESHVCCQSHGMFLDPTFCLHR